VQEEMQPNIAEIDPTPKVLNLALGQSPGRAILNIWHDKETDTGASLLNHVSGNAPNVVEVDADTLDNIAARFTVSPDFVKLDLQGAELAALKGATQVLKQAELMMIEFGCLEAYKGRTTARNLMDIMYDNNYCLYDIVGCHYRPYGAALTGGDFIFLKNSSKLRDDRGWE